jgi:hypothetical protein
MRADALTPPEDTFQDVSRRETSRQGLETPRNVIVEWAV